MQAKENKKLYIKISLLLAFFLSSFFSFTNNVSAKGGSMSIPGATINVGDVKTLSISVKSGQDNLAILGGMGSVVSNDSSCVSIQSVQGASVVDGTNFSTFSNNVVSSVATVTIKGLKNCETTIKVTGAEIDYSNLTADEEKTFTSGIIKVGSTQPVQPDNPSKPDNPTKPDDSSEPSKPDNPPQPTKNDPTPVTNKSSNAFLKKLNISGYNLNPQFNKNTTSYSITVNNNVESLGVTAYPEDSKSKVSISGNKNWKVGVNNVTITVIAENGNKKTYTIAVTRDKYVPLTGISLDYYSKDTIIGDTFKLNVTAMPSNAQLPNDIKYESNDISVATVDASGNVSAIGEGDATIYVYVNSKLMNSCKVSVHKYKKGDIDRDGKISLSDVILCLKMYFDRYPKNLETADVDYDNRITLSDVILILKMYFNVE